MNYHPLVLKAMGWTQTQADDWACLDSLRRLLTALSEYAELASAGRRYPETRLDALKNELLRLLKKLLPKYGVVEDGWDPLETYLNMQTAISQLERARTRVDKVIAIDAMFSLVHDRGYLLPMLYGLDPEGDEATVTERILDYLANQRSNPLYHGGRNLGPSGTLKFGQQGRPNSGVDAGAIFVTPTKQYAKQYIQPGGKLYMAKIDLAEEKIFDATKPEDLRRLETLTNRETIRCITDSIRAGAADWATLSQFTEELQEAGFTGAKFLEREHLNIEPEANGMSFKVSGPPVYSYGMFHEVPVEETSNPVTPYGRVLVPKFNMNYTTDEYGDTSYIFAWDGEIPIGTLEWGHGFVPSGIAPIKIGSIMVIPEYRQRGVAEAMLRMMKEKDPGRRVIQGNKTSHGKALAAALTKRGIPSHTNPVTGYHKMSYYEKERVSLWAALQAYEDLANAGTRYPEHRVNWLFKEFHDRFLHEYEDHWPDDQWVKPLVKMFHFAPTRRDRIIAIDSLIQAQHATGFVLTAMYEVAEYDDTDTIDEVEDKIRELISRLSRSDIHYHEFLNPVTPVTKASLAEMFKDDKACGVYVSTEFHPGEEWAMLPTHHEMGNCTNCARYAVKRVGRGRVFGFFSEDMPNYTYDEVLNCGGHDFAVIDDRYIVDLWLSLYAGKEKQTVYDMKDPRDIPKIKKIYGDPAYWKDMSKGELNPVTGYRTAIARVSPPAPLQLLHDRGLLKGRTLDFGSGRGHWYGMNTYDPHYQPRMPSGLFDTITCIYVLNVVSEQEEANITHQVISKLKKGGTAYFAVRRDIPKKGTATQRWSTPNLENVYEQPGKFAIYRAVKP